MKYSRNEITAGALILTAGVALTVFLIIVGQVGSIGRHIYRVRLEDAFLLREGSPVAVNGLKVGRVKSMKLVEQKDEDTLRTLAEVAAMRGERPVETVMNLLARHERMPAIVIFCMCEENLRRVLSWPFVAAGSDDSAGRTSCHSGSRQYNCRANCEVLPNRAR